MGWRLRRAPRESPASTWRKRWDSTRNKSLFSSFSSEKEEMFFSEEKEPKRLYSSAASHNMQHARHGALWRLCTVRPAFPLDGLSITPDSLYDKPS
jgi:hypothetical protein